MFAKLTGEFDAAIDTGIEDEFRFLDWVAAAKLGEEYAGIQSYLTDQGIVYRVMEVRKAAPLGNPNTLVVRPYEHRVTKDPLVVAAGGLRLRYDDPLGQNRVIMGRIYERLIDGTVGLANGRKSAYDIVDAIQVSSLIDRIKLAAEALNLTLTPDYTAVADPPMAP
jgi:hypothetical protein